MPFYRCTITTALTPAMTAERLRGLIQPIQTLRERVAAAFGDWPKEPFTGTLSDGAFKARRIIRYRNAVVPVIRGTYAMSETGGTNIHLLMTLHPSIAIFLLVWCGMFAYGALPIITTGTTPLDSRVLAIPALVLLIMLAAFYLEAIKAKRILADAMQA